MKIIKTEGCVAGGWTFDGKDLLDIPQAEEFEIFNYLCLKFKENMKDGSNSLTEFIELFQYDDYERDENVCSQCGDYVSRTYWEV